MKANKITLVLATIGLLALMVTPVLANGNGGNGEYTSDLYAGRDHNVVGLVTVDRIGDTLYVTYETTGCWSLVETHLVVASSYEEIPTTKKGNPKIGHFPYATEHDPMVTTFTYEVPVDDGMLYIAAHAVVYCDCSGVYETAWGQGDNALDFPGNSWALYFTFPDPET